VSVTVTNVSITVNAGTDGLLVVSLMRVSALSNVLLTVIPLPSQSHNSASDGLVIYYYLQTIMNVLFINNITYKQSCNSKEIQNLFYIAFYRNKVKIIVNIRQTVLDNLCHVRALYYHSADNTEVTKVHLLNCQVSNNTAGVIKDLDFSMLLIFHKSEQKDSLVIANSMFYRNTNISSMINITNPYTHNAFIVIIKNCTFNHNQVESIIKDYTDEIAVLWHHPIFISFHNTSISSNTHSNGKSLVSLNNGEVYIDNCIIVNNSYYENIIELHLSTLVLTDNVDISNNHARYLIYSMKYSHTTLFDQCIFKATKNIVYWPLGKEIAYSSQTNPVCYF